MTETYFNDCIEEFGDRIYRFILKISDDSEKAKDVSQDIFLKLWENKEFIDKTKIKAWLFKTAYNKWIDMERHNKFNVRETSLQEQITENGYSDLKMIMEKALSQLSEVQKSAVLLRDYEGYSYDEIGKILSISEQQVKVYIFRARTTLKKIIGKIENVI